MKTILVWCLLALPVLAQAQAVWRCGADGRSYTSTPCPEGRMVEVPDARPAADVNAAFAAAQRERRLADALAQARQQSEAANRSAGLASLSGPKPVAQPATRVVLRTKRQLRPTAAGGTWPEAARVSRRTAG